MRVPVRGGLVCGSAALLLVASSLAVAQEPGEQFSWSTEAGAERSDNVGRTATNEREETVGILGLNLTLVSDRRRLDSNVAAALEYRDYVDTEFESELAGGLDASFGFSIIPRNFIWVLDDNYGQLAKDRQVADTPDNREQVNYFSTGPDIIIPLGPRTQFQISGRWSDTYLEETDEDNNAVMGSVALARFLSEHTTLSLNASATDTKFDEPELFAGYQTRQAFLRLDLNGTRTTLVADGGYVEYDQDDVPDTKSFTMFKFDLARKIGTRSQLRLTAGTAPSSTGETFTRDQTVLGVGEGPDAAQAAGDLFRSDDAFLVWTTDWERTSFSASINGRREEHEQFKELDREVKRGTLAFTRELTRSLKLDLFGGYLEEERTQTGFKFDDWFAGSELGWDFAERFSLIVRLDHFVGSSEDGTRDYTENRAYLGIRYRGGRDGGGY
jgi:hypothetical protein